MQTRCPAATRRMTARATQARRGPTGARACNAWRASTLVKQALPSVSPVPWASSPPPWAHPLAWRVRRHLADTARLAQSLPQVHSVLRATTVWVDPVISRHAVRTQASTAQLDLHLQQEHSALLVLTVREVRVTSNSVPWARTLPILAPLHKVPARDVFSIYRRFVRKYLHPVSSRKNVDIGQR